MKFYLFGGPFGASIAYGTPEELGIPEEKLLKAVVLDELPIPEEREGYYSRINCNKETNEVWFDYIKLREPIILLEENAE